MTAEPVFIILKQILHSSKPPSVFIQSDVSMWEISPFSPLTGRSRGGGELLCVLPLVVLRIWERKMERRKEKSCKKRIATVASFQINLWENVNQVFRWRGRFKDWNGHNWALSDILKQCHSKSALGQVTGINDWHVLSSYCDMPTCLSWERTIRVIPPQR